MKIKKLKPKPEWLNVAETAKHFRISKETVYRFVKRKKIPVHKIGKSLRFNLKEIDQWAMRK